MNNISNMNNDNIAIVYCIFHEHMNEGGYEKPEPGISSQSKNTLYSGSTTRTSSNDTITFENNYNDYRNTSRYSKEQDLRYNKTLGQHTSLKGATTNRRHIPTNPAITGYQDWPTLSPYDHKKS